MATSTPSPKSPAPVKAWETILDCNVIPVYHNAISGPLLPMSSVRQLTALHKTHKKIWSFGEIFDNIYNIAIYETCNENWYRCIGNPSFSTASRCKAPLNRKSRPLYAQTRSFGSSPVPGVPSREGNEITRGAHLDTNSRETQQQQHNTETRVRGKEGRRVHQRPDVGGAEEFSSLCISSLFEAIYHRSTATVQYYRTRLKNRH